jgi:hypothetical protein
VSEVSGRVVDAGGEPIAGLLTSVCGPVCFYAESDDAGSFVVEVGRVVTADDYSMLPHGRPDHTSFYFPLPEEITAAEIDLGDLLLLSMPEVGPELVVKTDRVPPPVQELVSGEVTLRVAEGVEVALDVEDVTLGSIGKQFRALRIPEQHRAAFAEPELELTALYAFSPFEARFQDPESGEPAFAELEFDNTEDLPAGAELEVLALGSYLIQDWLSPARFELIGRASVSEDGARIRMAEGHDLRALTWVGLRPVP